MQDNFIASQNTARPIKANLNRTGPFAVFDMPVEAKVIQFKEVETIHAVKQAPVNRVKKRV